MKKVYKFGDILITANYTDNWSCPSWSDDIHPEYIITIRERGNKIRHSVHAWGNIADAPDVQHRSLAGIVLEEHLRDYGSFNDFCSEYGYDTDSRKAEKIYKQLLTSWNNGLWLNLCENSKQYKDWIKSGDDIENYLEEL